MERQVEIFIMVEANIDLTIGDELLINYPFIKFTPTRNRREEEGLLRDIPKRRKPKNKK